MSEIVGIDESLSPHLGEEQNAPLSALVRAALIRYGETHPDTYLGDSTLVFIGLANEIIEEMLTHPYHDGSAINYYRSIEDRRAVPDAVMVNGLMYKWAADRRSENARNLYRQYTNMVNRVMYRKRYGPEDMERQLKMQRVDPRDSSESEQ